MADLFDDMANDAFLDTSDHQWKRNKSCCIVTVLSDDGNKTSSDEIAAVVTPSTTTATSDPDKKESNPSKDDCDDEDSSSPEKAASKSPATKESSLEDTFSENEDPASSTPTTIEKEREASSSSEKAASTQGSNKKEDSLGATISKQKDAASSAPKTIEQEREASFSPSTTVSSKKEDTLEDIFSEEKVPAPCAPNVNHQEEHEASSSPEKAASTTVSLKKEDSLEVSLSEEEKDLDSSAPNGDHQEDCEVSSSPNKTASPTVSSKKKETLSEEEEAVARFNRIAARRTAILNSHFGKFRKSKKQQQRKDSSSPGKASSTLARSKKSSLEDTFSKKKTAAPNSNEKGVDSSLPEKASSTPVRSNKESSLEDIFSEEKAAASFAPNTSQQGSESPLRTLFNEADDAVSRMCVFPFLASPRSDVNAETAKNMEQDKHASRREIKKAKLKVLAQQPAFVQATAFAAVVTKCVAKYKEHGLHALSKTDLVIKASDFFKCVDGNSGNVSLSFLFTHPTSFDPLHSFQKSMPAELGTGLAIEETKLLGWIVAYEEKTTEVLPLAYFTPSVDNMEMAKRLFLCLKAFCVDFFESRRTPGYGPTFPAGAILKEKLYGCAKDLTDNILESQNAAAYFFKGHEGFCSHEIFSTQA